MIYVVDTNSKLLDDIPIRRFILSEPGLSVKNIMDGKFISVLADSDQEYAYHIMKKYRINALPVVNSSNSLLGIVTIDDIIEILEEEITEDFHKLSAINPVEENYFRASPFFFTAKECSG